MTVIYSVNTGEDPEFFPTKALAMRAALDAAADSYEWEGAIEVTANHIRDDLGKRELLCAMVNGHWAQKVETVATFQGKKRSE